MTELVGLDKHQDEHDVHHRGVKLEAGVARAHVEDDAEDALQNHAEAHAVKQAVLCWNTELAADVLLGFVEEKPSFEMDDDNEDDTVADVATVADNVIDVIKSSVGSRAAKVEVAQLQGSRLLVSPQRGVDHLNGGKEIID